MKTESTFPSRLEPLIENEPNEENQFHLPLLKASDKFFDLKDLDKWDEQHLKIQSQKHHSMIKRKATNLLQKSSLMCLNYKTNVSSDFNRLKSSFTNKNVTDFYKNIQQETSSLLAQNINMVKKRFDFGIFSKSPIKYVVAKKKTSRKTQEELYQIGNEIAIRKKISSNMLSGGQYNTLIDNDEEISIQNRILKQNNLKLEGKYQKVVSSEYYKEIVKNKNILEKAYRKEIKAVSKQIELAEKEARNLNNELKTLYKQVEEKKRNYFDSKDVYTIMENERNLNSTTREFVQQTREIDLNKRLKTQIEILKKDYEQQKLVNEVNIDYIKEEVNEIKIGIKTLQIYKKSIIKQLIDYYYQILKEGVDVRSIGLCWVLIRIYELGVSVSNKHFPNFLEYISINYLMEYSKKAIIKKKLDVVLRLLVKMYLISAESEETKLNEEITQINNEYILFQNLVEFIQKLNQKFKNKLVTQNELIILKDEEILQKSKNQLRDLAAYQDLLILENTLKQGMSDNEEIKKKQHKRECDSLEETKEDLNLSNVNKNKNRTPSELINQKEIVDACAHIRVEKQKIDNEMKRLKETQVKFFKRKYEKNKSKGISECLKYDLMYCALFGNYAVV